MKLTLVLLLSVLPQMDALDFQYSVATTAGEGGEYSYLRFQDGGAAVSYMPPKSWRYSGSSSILRFSPPAAMQVEAHVAVQTLERKMDVDTEEQATFEGLARSSLPPGATKVELRSIGPAMQIDGRNTVEAMLRYTFFGGTFDASVLFLTRGKDLLTFSISGPPPALAENRALFHASLSTFAGLEPERVPRIAPRATVFAREMRLR